LRITRTGVQASRLRYLLYAERSQSGTVAIKSR